MTARPRIWPFLVSAAGLVVLFAGVYAYFVRGYMGQTLDERAKNGMRLGPATHLAETILNAVPVTCVALAVLAAVIGLARRRVAVTVIALGVTGGAVVTTEVLKHSLLTRPGTGATDTLHNSFPSGHTTVVAAVLFALFLVSPPRLRPVVATLGSVATVAVGAMLVGTQWHRPSDVVGGILIVAIWGCLGGAVAARLRSVAPRVRPAGLTAMWVVAGLLGVAAAAALGTVYVSSEDHLTLAALGGLLAIAAVGASNAAALTRLFLRVG